MDSRPVTSVFTNFRHVATPRQPMRGAVAICGSQDFLAVNRRSANESRVNSCGFEPYSPFMSAALTIGHHFSISAF